MSLIPAPTNGTLAAHQGEWFESWWAIYWRKVARKPAEKAFRKCVRTAERFDAVMAATQKQSATMMARDPDKRPHGATWLNGERWNDEPSAPAHGGGSSRKPTMVENVTRIFGERIARGEKPW